jgi:hypothetical protein
MDDWNGVDMEHATADLEHEASLPLPRLRDLSERQVRGADCVYGCGTTVTALTAVPLRERRVRVLDSHISIFPRACQLCAELAREALARPCPLCDQPLTSRQHVARAMLPADSGPDRPAIVHADCPDTPDTATLQYLTCRRCHQTIGDDEPYELEAVPRQSAPPVTVALHARPCVPATVSAPPSGWGRR